MRVLVVNAGSSSLKLRLLNDDDTVLRSADLPAGGADLNGAIADWPRPDIVGHRVVHGGTHYTGGVVIEADVEARIRALSDLAPLHQPKSVAAMESVAGVLPGVPAVACFDTAFHHTIPPAAATYALPAAWRAKWPLRKYGFHGLSVAYCTRRVAELVPDARRVVVCHLGAGASVTATVDGRSVDTTMGFTPLDGLVMATRSGSVDPGLVLWLEEHENLTPREVAVALESRSGLLGIAGSADLREVLARAGAGDSAARLAVDVYVHRLVGAAAAMGASCGGLDALVFTGGVGEHAASIRVDVSAALAFLGVEIDIEKNASAAPDVDIAALRSQCRVLVVTSREDLQIAAECRAAVALQDIRSTSKDLRL